MERIGTLLFRYVRKELSREEEKELTDWRYTSPENENFFQEKTDREHLLTELAQYLETKDRVFQQIKERYPGPWEQSPVSRRLQFYQVLRVALFVIVILGAGLYFLWNSPKTVDAIQPGRYQAVLVSLDGIPRSLDDFHRGFLLGSEGIRIEKMENGDLLYIAPNNTQAPKGTYITLYTLRGGKFGLRLPDGTQMWLNAQSSVKYPANFSQDSVLVTVEGEAYVELAKKAKPGLWMNAGPIWIEAPGAQFNIRSYRDEPVDLTLTKNNAIVRLAPGLGMDPAEFLLHPYDQVKLVKTHKGETLEPAVLTTGDIQDIIAWKNGNIAFRDANIQTAMRVISRWYDADIVYIGDIPDQKYSLRLASNTSLNFLLSNLEKQGGHFTVQGKTITVSK